jgi:hypothetical protein
MRTRSLPIAHAVLALAGIGLMVGGIVTRRHGATVAGIVVAGINVTRWLRTRRTRGVRPDA